VYVGVGFRRVFNTVSSDFNAVSNSGSGIQLPRFEWRLDAFRLHQIASPVAEVVISLINEGCVVIFGALCNIVAPCENITLVAPSHGLDLRYLKLKLTGRAMMRCVRGRYVG